MHATQVAYFSALNNDLCWFASKCSAGLKGKVLQAGQIVKNKKTHATWSNHVNPRVVDMNQGLHA